MTVRVIALFFLVFLSLTASADALTGKVVKITDGDTLYIFRYLLSRVLLLFSTRKENTD